MPVGSGGGRQDGKPKPRPEYLRKIGRLNAAREAFAALTPDERMEVLSNYCTFCGGPSGCVCMRDE